MKNEIMAGSRPSFIIHRSSLVLKYWRAAVVLPHARRVLEARLRMLALDPRKLRKWVRLPGIAPGHAPWRGAILLLNHNLENKTGTMPGEEFSNHGLTRIKMKLLRG